MVARYCTSNQWPHDQVERDGNKRALEVAALVAARAAAAEGAVERKVDVLLAVHAHHEGRHVHDLLAHPVAAQQTCTRSAGSIE